MRPGNPPPRRRGRGANQANRTNRANPPPSDPARARHVTFQVTYGVGWEANRANRGWGGGNPALHESGRASRPCDWPRLAMVAGVASL